MNLPLCSTWPRQMLTLSWECMIPPEVRGSTEAPVIRVVGFSVHDVTEAALADHQVVEEARERVENKLHKGILLTLRSTCFHLCFSHYTLQCVKCSATIRRCKRPLCAFASLKRTMSR